MRNRDALSIKVVLYRSKTLANGEHPLMVRITRNRKPRYKSLGISCRPTFWDDKNGVPKRNHPNLDLLESIIAKKISAYKTKKLELQNDGKDFTALSIVNSVEGNLRRVSVFKFFDEVSERLKMSDQIGNSIVYNTAKNALFDYTKTEETSFSEIDYTFLIKFEAHLRKKKMMETSLSVYFRTLRALYNKAIQENIAKQADYPFNQFKLSKAKFNTETRKRAITKEDIKKIENFNVSETSYLFEAKQYFLFSYYGQGVNFVDLASLKWNNISDNRVFYTRAKTGKEMNFVLLTPAHEILNYWRPVTGHESDNYIFPILNKDKHITSTQINNRVHKVIGNVNIALKEIGQLTGITMPITTYVARHTFATVLKRSNISTAIISEAMGHQTEAITNTYLKSFENEIIDQAVQSLI